MDFAEIETARAAAQINQKDLCQRANVNPTTYSQIKNGRRGAYVRTIERLKAGLAALIAEKDRTNG